MHFISVMEFSASLLQSSVSHDPSEILICEFSAQQTFLSLSKVENSCVAKAKIWEQKHWCQQVGSSEGGDC